MKYVISFSIVGKIGMSIEFPNVMTSGTDASAIKQQFSFFNMLISEPFIIYFLPYNSPAGT